MYHSHATGASPFQCGQDATETLLSGNRVFASLRSGEFQLPADELYEPHQPFAAVLSCTDARIPISRMFQQDINRILQVRVSGNVLSDEAAGSLELALARFPTLKSIAVIGHNDCEAVATAMDFYRRWLEQSPPHLSRGIASLVQRLLPAVREAEEASHRPQTLAWISPLALATIINASNTALQLQQLVTQWGRSDVHVTFGVYDLSDRLIHTWDNEHGFHSGLSSPFTHSDQLLEYLAATQRV